MATKKTVNEKSSLYMTLTFKDELGADLIPSSVEWRLDDMELDALIVDWTALPSPAATMNMLIPASNNVIVDETNVREARMYGVRVNNGLGSEAHQQFKYHVLNLRGPSGA